MDIVFFFFKQKPAYEMRISDWSSDVCSSDLVAVPDHHIAHLAGLQGAGALEHTERARGVLGEPTDCPFRRNRDTGTLGTADHLARFLIQPLDAFGRIRMHDGAADRKSTRLNSSH